MCCCKLELPYRAVKSNYQPSSSLMSGSAYLIYFSFPIIGLAMTDAKRLTAISLNYIEDIFAPAIWMVLEELVW